MKIKVHYRGKGKIWFMFGRRFSMQFECWPPFLWHGRCVIEPGHIRVAWGLWQFIGMNWAYATKIVADAEAKGNKV